MRMWEIQYQIIMISTQSHDLRREWCGAVRKQGCTVYTILPSVIKPFITHKTVPFTFCSGSPVRSRQIALSSRSVDKYKVNDSHSGDVGRRPRYWRGQAIKLPIGEKLNSIFGCIAATLCERRFNVVRRRSVGISIVGPKATSVLIKMSTKLVRLQTNITQYFPIGFGFRLQFIKVVSKKTAPRPHLLIVGI